MKLQQQQQQQLPKQRKKNNLIDNLLTNIKKITEIHLVEHRKEITKNAMNKFIQSQTTCCFFILHLFALQLMQWILKRISFLHDITSLWCMRKCVFNHSSVSILYFQCVLFAFQVDASITYRMHIVCSNTTSRKYYNS